MDSKVTSWLATPLVLNVFPEEPVRSFGFILVTSQGGNISVHYSVNATAQ